LSDFVGAQPLLSAYLTESGVPLWAAAFIDKLLPSEALTLAEEANGLRVPMYVMRDTLFAC
jgi:hypothetical protein